MKFQPRKYIRRLLLLISCIFIIFNIWIAVQAYSLTHFSEEKSITNLKLGVSTLFTGITISKPRSDIKPKIKYKTLIIPSEEGGFLETWLLQPEKPSRGLVILFHGFRAEKSSMLDRAYTLRNMGYKVLLVDFEGAGNSSGNQCTTGYLEAKNVKQVYDYAINSLNEKHIILCGFSMGAAAIIKAQYDYSMKVNGIILEAPYGRMIDAVKVRLNKLPYAGKSISYLVTFWGGTVNGFNAFTMNPEDYIKNIKVPVLLLCGGKDPRIPIEESKQIFKNCGSSYKKFRLFPESYHHSYLEKYPEEWKNTVTNFLSVSD